LKRFYAVLFIAGLLLALGLILYYAVGYFGADGSGLELPIKTK